MKSHTFRKTVATLLDDSGASARMVADQLGHSRVSMTQDVYLGRKAKNAGNVAALEASNPDAEEAAGQSDSSPDSSPDGYEASDGLGEAGSH